ncbi:MAG: GDP-mannose 4,6-dehydratase [Candidatus Falkowbacteria bacterium]
MNEFYQGKNVLVTGATGLVGGHLVEKLLSYGANIFITQRSSVMNSYFSLMGMDKKVSRASCDIKDYARVFDVISKYEIEYIFHVAAQPIVQTAIVNPLETFETNIMGTINILEAARHCPKIKGIVVASSDKAYGKKCDNATETAPMAGDHPYDVSKSCTDLIARTYAKTYNLPVAVSRFGNIYGPGDLNMNRIIPGVMKAIIKNETLEIRSDGKFVRDYVFVKDVADGYVLLMSKIVENIGEAYNFSTGYNLSVVDLIKKISEVIGEECKYEIKNFQQNEIPSQSLNYEKATTVLGWKSDYTFEAGIRETFDWYKKLLV